MNNNLVPFENDVIGGLLLSPDLAEHIPKGFQAEWIPGEQQVRVFRWIMKKVASGIIPDTRLLADEMPDDLEYAYKVIGEIPTIANFKVYLGKLLLYCLLYTSPSPRDS